MMCLRLCSRVALLLSAALLSACSLLVPPSAKTIDRYVLEPDAVAPVADAVSAGPVVLVTAPRTTAALDTQRMAYMRQAQSLRYFTQARWADTPPRMLNPLLANALQQHAAFSGVVQVPGVLPADLRVDSELVHFEQDFTVRPSVMRVSLRVQVVDLRTRTVRGTHTFDVREPAPEETSYGGALAANRALSRLLSELAGFVAGFR